MTDKQIIKLKPIEDLNEKIIKEKGNTKCIFYADDICRNGDRTRDCVNCARIKYRSLYNLNWNNQDRLFKQLDQLKEELAISIQENEEGREINAELKAENETYKKMLEDEEVILALTEVRTGERHLWYSNAQKLEQALTEIKEILDICRVNNCNSECELYKVDDCQDERLYRIRQILQKISEVIDE